MKHARHLTKTFRDFSTLDWIMTLLPASALDGTQDKGPAIIAVFAVTLAVAILLLAARLYVRARILQKIWLDDLFTIIGVVRIKFSGRSQKQKQY